jgi:hypothetical protein
MLYQSEMLAERAASHRAQQGQVNVELGAESLDQFILSLYCHHHGTAPNSAYAATLQ